jgi:asparagine synthase (glutamine-hydrolysing)
MSDFLLDFRSVDQRREAAHQAASLLKFCHDTRVETVENDSFTLVLTRVDELGLWGPYEYRSDQGNLLITLAGRIALDERQWDAARKITGPGGLACKAIFQMYRQGGVNSLGALNGNFLVLIHDQPAGKFFLVTDRCGMYLAYGRDRLDRSLVFCSHPDVLASVLGESQAWDKVSLAEFLMTSRLTFPYTYYQNIRGIEPGFIYTINLQHGAAAYESKRRYFDFNFKIEPQITEWNLAEELASAFKNAVRRRTLPLLGRVGVALSGGLDSRAVLSAAGHDDHIQAFCLFDEPNAEYRVAKAIADACGVKLIPVKRDFEYYGNSAELGVRISGGTGCITCNHFLGIRNRLKELGIQSLLTGCYCDYLLKGLALNTAERMVSRTRRLAGFQFEFYDPFSRIAHPYREEVAARLAALFPEATQGRLSEQDWLNVERKRIFPLAYEQDLAQRVIPQRVMPWYLLIVDNDIIETYLKMPSRYKLNASVFKKILTFLDAGKLCAIPDSNTGAPVNASWPSQAWHRYRSSIRNRIDGRFARRMATPGSWPNWRFYLQHSKVIEQLWTRPNPAARTVFTEILGQDPYRKSIQEYAGSDLVLFLRLLTQKLWFDQRIAK